MVKDLRDDAAADDRSQERPQDQLERRAQELFEDSVEQLDARTRSKLTQARHAALDEIRKSPAPLRWLRAPTGGLAAAALVAVVILTWQAARQPTQPVVPLDDLEMVADAENLEILRDVEFYAWLDQQ